jgi:hypothetical protein
VLWSDRAQAHSLDVALRRGLAEAGFVEDSNLVFAGRYAGNDVTQLAPLAFAAFPIRSMEDVRAAFLSQSNDVDGMHIYGNPLLRNNVTAFVDLAIAAKNRRAFAASQNRARRFTFL